MFPLAVETTYTKERLVRFSHATSLARTWFWGFFVVFTAIMSVLCSPFITKSPSPVWLLIATLVLDAFCILNHAVVPYFTLSKAENLNTLLQYTFHESSFDLKASSVYTESSTVIQYSAIKKISHRGRDLYLYLSARHGFIVDTEPLSTEQLSALKTALASHVPDKNIKWFDED